LTDLFSNDEAWNKAREEVLADYDKIDALRGTLGVTAVRLSDKGSPFKFARSYNYRA